MKRDHIILSLLLPLFPQSSSSDPPSSPFHAHPFALPTPPRLLQASSHGSSSSLPEIANRPNAARASSRGDPPSADNATSIPMGHQCKVDVDCLSKFGKCQNGRCRGFYPDLSDERLIRCVDGYRCEIKAGDLRGIDIQSDMQVIAISPTDKCGAVNPLKSSQSIFANSNRWECSPGGTNGDSCVFNAGVGMRRNKAAAVEGVRLCGCPGIDGDGSGVSCDNKREFYVPIGKLSTQECLRNAHCIHNEFAYCVYDHCASPSGVMAGAGLKIFQCVTSRDCSIKKLTSKTVEQAMKVLPVAANFNCGSFTALDPDAIDDAALPCVVDINEDGVCDVNLGVARVLGTTRLCGCTGDRGGNGRDCDQPEDFTDELGLVQVGECILDTDCPTKGQVCIEGECHSDTVPPYVVSTFPTNSSCAVPPVPEVILTWNENIKYTKTGGRKLLIASTDLVTNPRKWEMEIRDPATFKIAEAGYALSIKGRDLRVIPDVNMRSLPEGRYIVGYEGGIVSDLQDNFNEGAVNIIFTVSKTADCPFLYITGFSTEDVNPNGLYTAIEPMNGHAAWRGGARDPLYVYWKTADPARDQPGNWILAVKADQRHFIGYADLKLMSALGKAGEVRPPTGKWRKWQHNKWTDQAEVTMTCKKALDRTYPKLIEIFPKIGATGVDPKHTRIMMRFSKPVTYGHWANISLIPREVASYYSRPPSPAEGGEDYQGDDDDDDEMERSSFPTIQIDPDFDSGMRGLYIKSDMAGVVELDLEGLADLGSGVTYDIVADLGCLTDLEYNPWGPVKPGVLYFTTYGLSCAPFPNLGSGYDARPLNGTHHHGDSYQVKCAKGYTLANEHEGGSGAKYESAALDDTDTDDAAATDYEGDDSSDLPSSSSEKRGSGAGSGAGAYRVVSCIDGRWDDISNFVCSADCPLFYGVGPEYMVLEGREVSHHGDKLHVVCAPSAIVMEGTNGTAETTCNDGKWSPLKLKCGATCGPFPSLGPNYKVTYDASIDRSQEASSTIVGARRIVSCAPPAKPDAGSGSTGGGRSGEQVVVCEEKGWGEIKLRCHVACSSLPQYSAGYKLESLTGGGSTDDTAHGTTFKVSCAKGYTPGPPPVNPTSLSNFPADEGVGSQTPASTTVSCHEGRWEQKNQFTCYKNCGAFDRGSGYEVTSLSGGLSHGARILVKCAAESTQTSGDVGGEVLFCHDGSWDLGKIVCEAPCPRPEEKLGGSYVAEIISVPYKTPSDLLGQGSTAFVYCSPSSTLIAGSPPEFAVCANGDWIPAVSAESQLPTSPDRENDENSRDISDDNKLKLKCESGCKPFNKDLTKYRNLAEGDGPSLDYSRPPTDTESAPGASLKIGCLNGFSPQPPSRPFGTLTCSDGKWLENAEKAITCLADCSGEEALTALTSRGFELLSQRRGSRPPTSIKHGDKIQITCAGTAYARVVEGGAQSSLDLTISDYARSTVPLNAVGQASCFNGKVKLPWLLHCAVPTCNDGIMNGDEEGVDCGGSQCARKCSVNDACREGLSTCQPSCSDGMLNGDEEGIDCGGSHCRSCAYCRGLPPEVPSDGSIVLTNDGGRTLLLSNSTGTTPALRFPENTRLDAACAPGFDQTSDAPVLGFQSFQCSEGGGGGSWSWRLGDDALTFALKCSRPSCSDGILNGDEEEVDCGGSCPARCPSCSDGIQNQDEEAIDCGGTHCMACSGCDINIFKNLNRRAIKLEYLSSRNDVGGAGVRRSDRELPTPIELKEMWNLTGTSHMSRRQITCRRRPNVSLTLQCDNGQWKVDEWGGSGVQMPAFRSASQAIHNLDCGEEDPVDIAEQNVLINSQFQSFKPPTLAPPHSCVVTPAPSKPANLSCCALPSEMQQILGAECGALLFGSRSSQVSGFCRGACQHKLNDIITKYEGIVKNAPTPDLPGCENLHLLKEMLQVFCHTNEGGSGGTKTYCFASAAETLSQMKNLGDLRAGVLTAACQPDSCFSSNLRYFEILRALTLQHLGFSPDGSDSPDDENYYYSSEGGSGVRRNLRDQEGVDESAEVQFALIEEKSRSHFGNLMRRVLTESFGELPTLPNDFTKSEGAGAPRSLAAISSFLTSAASSSAVRQLTVEHRYSRSLLKFMCLTDGEGKSCGAVVQRLVAPDPLSEITYENKRGGSGSTNRTGTSTSSALAAIKSSPCSDKCVLQVTRHLGQALLDLGLYSNRTPDPYLAMLGLLMRSFSRAACQMNAKSHNCGDLFNPNFINSYQPRGKRGVGSSEGVGSLFPLCKCPTVYIGDGHCDLICFNPECEFDGGDCDFAKMFPAAYQSLTAVVALNDPCNPLNSRFSCNSRGATPDCHAQIIQILNSDGCCAATRWETLREALRLDQRLRERVGSSDDAAEGGAGGLVLDRSSDWLDMTCGISSDRGCSRGLKRFIIQMRFKLEKLKYEAMDLWTRGDESGVVPVEIATLASSDLTARLREAISDVLALPTPDVREIRLWEGSVAAEVLVDPGASLNEVVRDLEVAEKSGTLAKGVNAAVKLYLKDMISKTNLPLDTFVEVASSEKKRRLGSGDTDVSQNSGAGNTQLSNFIDNFSYKLIPVQYPPPSSTRPPRVPDVGTLDMGDLAPMLTKPNCPESLGLSPPPDFTATSSENSVYFSDPSYGRGVNHGAERKVSCARGYLPSLIDSGKSPQKFQCDRGRWVTENHGEPKLICRMPCGSYLELDSGFNESTTAFTLVKAAADKADRKVLSLYGAGGAGVTRDVDTDADEGPVYRDGSQALISCLAGYQAVALSKGSGGVAGETQRLTCRNGVWDRRSIECVKAEDGSSALFNSLCGSTRIGDVLDPNEEYSLRLLLSNATAAAAPAAASSSHVKTAVVSLWSVKCARGYIPGDPAKSQAAAAKKPQQSIALFCVNGGLYGNANFKVADWDGRSGDAENRISVEKSVEQEILRIYSDFTKDGGSGAKDTVFLTNATASPSSTSSFSQTSLLTSPTPALLFRRNLLECEPDIRIPPILPTQQPGLTNPQFYAIIFGSIFVLMGVGIYAYYLRRTHCMKVPFFAQHEEPAPPGEPEGDEGPDSRPSPSSKKSKDNGKAGAPLESNSTADAKHDSEGDGGASSPSDPTQPRTPDQGSSRKRRKRRNSAVSTTDPQDRKDDENYYGYDDADADEQTYGNIGSLRNTRLEMQKRRRGRRSISHFERGRRGGGREFKRGFSEKSDSDGGRDQTLGTPAKALAPDPQKRSAGRRLNKTLSPDPSKHDRFMKSHKFRGSTDGESSNWESGASFYSEMEVHPDRLAAMWSISGSPLRRPII